MKSTQQVFENGRLTGENVTNSGPNGSEVTHVQTVHHGSLGTTYKTTDAVITTDRNGNVHVDDRTK